MKQKLNIILFGEKNTGKSSVLMMLAAELGGISFTSSAWDSKVNRIIYKGKILWDARFVINYNNKLVFIATGGDSWAINTSNYNFFCGQELGRMNIYSIKTGIVKQLTTKETSVYQQSNDKPITVAPDLSICACRPDGNRRGAIKAIHSYSEDIFCQLGQYGYDQLDQFALQVWIQRNKQKDAKIQAKELLGSINDYCSKGTISLPV